MDLCSVWGAVTLVHHSRWRDVPTAKGGATCVRSVCTTLLRQVGSAAHHLRVRAAPSLRLKKRLCKGWSSHDSPHRLRRRGGVGGRWLLSSTTVMVSMVRHMRVRRWWWWLVVMVSVATVVTGKAP